MSKLIAIAATELRIFLSDGANLVGLLLIPIVLTVVLGFVGSGGQPSIYVGVVDADQSETSAAFLSEIANINAQFVVRLRQDTDVEAARQALVNGSYNALLVIPSGFEDSLTSFEPLELAFYSNEEPTAPSAIQPAISAVLGRYNSSITATRVGLSIAENIGAEVEADTLFNTASAILAQNPVEIDFQVSSTGDDGSENGFNQSVPGMGTMFVMFTILGGMALFIREREQWTLQRLIVMPVRRWQIIGGKILAYFTLGMIQYVVVFAVGYFFGVEFGSNILGLLLVAMAFSLAATAMTFSLATFLRTEGQAGQLSTLLALSLASIGGAWWPLEAVPEFMRVIGHVSPVAWAMDGFQDIIWYNRGIIDVLPEVGVLIAIAAGLFLIGILNFKYE